ncbi:unnamed protein product [Rhizoctonia solani]|uniref:BAG domain-containing protein n=1 Tax=Rhizoctonia solani TaxID=456999 RepID=A0A8H3B1H8_9AGAM|nr:unnamed protein product [Rhizoctonia solani]
MVSRLSNSACGSPTRSTYSYEFAPEYLHSSTHSVPASGYPYMPHNATVEERKTCNSRIRAIRARNASYNQSVQSGPLKPQGYGSRTDTRAGEADIPAGQPSSEPSVEIHSSSEEDESSGPETPYSHDRFFWKDSPDEALEQENLDHSHPQGRKVYYGSYKYYPPAPPVVPEEQHTSEVASDNFTTASSSTARKELQKLTYEFNTLILRFKFPSNLEFTNPSNEGQLPILAHTPASKPLLEHTHKLEKLLEKLDAVESHGDKEIQRMRKQAVERMLSELEGLKRMEAMALYNFNYERGIKA